MPPKKKKTKPVRQHLSLWLFLFFVLIAAVIVIALEYLDFAQGKYSFIFNKVLQMKAAATPLDVHQQAQALLKKNGCAYTFFHDQAGLGHFRISVKPDEFPLLLKTLHNFAAQNRLKLEFYESQLHDDDAIDLYKLEGDGQIYDVLLISRRKANAAPRLKTQPLPQPMLPAPSKPLVQPLPERKPAQQNVSGQARVAFIIDDIGYKDGVARILQQFDIPITAAIIPFAPYAESESLKVHEFGMQQIIHLPMQSINGNNNHSGEVMITIHSTEDEMAFLVRKAIDVIPYAEGVNNHMGSLVTSNREQMRKLLAILKRENLFFIDSRTTTATVAFDIAKEMSIKTAYRDIFLDDLQTYAHSVEQMKRLGDIALLKGQALAIGHPFESTFTAIREGIPLLKNRGISIVYAFEFLE